MPIRNPQKLAIILGLLAVTGCESIEGTIGLALGTTAVGGQTPSTELEQLYYLGVFDPQDQLPPTVYRVRVRGQASFISFAKFASGWVPAEVIDSLGTTIGFGSGAGDLSLTKADGIPLANLETGRRLVLFGPEGFREAPADHRLAIAMGSDPSVFFNAISESLAIVAQAELEQQSGVLSSELFDALAANNAESAQLNKFAAALDPGSDQ